MAVPTQFRKIVGGATLAAGGVGIPGAFAFGADVPVLVSIWVGGASLIAVESGHSADEEVLKGLATSAASGAAAFFAGSRLASVLFNLIPGPGTVAAIGVNSSLNAFFTYRFLRSVSKVYDKFDGEEIMWQTLRNGVALSSLSIFTIWSDASDMVDCMKDGSEFVKDFQNMI